MKRLLAALALIFWIFTSAPPTAAADGTTPKCAVQEYRQEHLQECNRQAGPAFGVGGGGAGGGRGIIGGILHRVPGLGGLF